MNLQFLEDVNCGLSKEHKTLPSKYFYDKRGDELFMQIMSLPEYYLTRAEAEIFRNQAEAIVHSFKHSPHQHFELIELGAGDGSKTFYLLKELLAKSYSFDYVPIDISGNVLTHLENTLLERLPDLSIEAQQGDYFKKLNQLKENAEPKVLLFLGSNIGNMTDEVASEFIFQIGANLKPNDRLLLGVDLIKPAKAVLPAYSDSQGITREFNLNLLQRINSELDGQFNLGKFSHCAEYTEEEGISRSYIVSKIDQQVTIGKLDKTFNFAKDERIHTEISRKYSMEILESILSDTDFSIESVFTDSQNYFADIVLQRN